MSTVRLFRHHIKAFNILIVEDDLAFQESLKKLLTKECYHVFTAKDGEEALEQIKNAEIHLIITDLYLGNLSKIHGFELLESLKNSVIPIIVLSAFGDCGDYINKAKEKGAFAFLNKPVKKNKLMKTIQKALNQEE